MDFPGLQRNVGHDLEDLLQDQGQEEKEGFNKEEKIRQMFTEAQHNYFPSNFEDRINSLDITDTATRRKYEEDGRLDFLLRMQKTMNETFDNPAYVHPHGMTSFDYKSIAQGRKKGLESYKVL